MKSSRMEKLHPACVLIYFIEALVLCFSAEWQGLCVIFGAIFLFSVINHKARSILWALPLAAFMFILNPIFYHSGVTVLFSVKGINFTLEAIENGIYSALLILCTILIFTCLGAILSEEKFLYVFGRFFPKLSLMISMIFRHFDILSRAYTQTKEMAQMNGCYDKNDSLLGKLKTAAVVFEAFTGTALEGSIETAYALEAKGYYSKNKTVIKKYRFGVWDAIFIIVISAIFAPCFIKSMLSLIPLGLFFLIPVLLIERGKKR